MTRLNHLPVDDRDVIVEGIAHEAQDIANVSADFRQAKGHRRTSLFETINERLDDLLYTMMDAFSEPLEEERAAQLLREHHPLTQTRLAKLPRGGVPLVVMRELIAVHQVPIDRDRLQNWQRFSERFHHAV